MLEFKEAELSDKPWVDSILSNKYRNADLCFTNIYLWKDCLNTRISRIGDRLIIKTFYNEKPVYTFPTGRGDLHQAIEAIKEDALKSGEKLYIRGIPSSEVENLNGLFPDEFDLKAEYSSFDYVYSASALAELAGKKYHSKKNHINRFIAENDWAYEPINKNNLSVCVQLTEEWLKAYGSKLVGTILDEKSALKRLFEDYYSLDLEGGILWANGKAVAYTVGEVLSRDTYVTHFEKAFSDVNGAYPMINREFARQIIRDHPDMIYINREEDMGIENIRKAKESYHPDMMVEKYIAEWR